MDTDAWRENQPLKFFSFSHHAYDPILDFWSKLPVPMKLPVGALASFNSMIAALILSYWQSGSSGVKELIRKVLDLKNCNSPRRSHPLPFSLKRMVRCLQIPAHQQTMLGDRMTLRVKNETCS